MLRQQLNIYKRKNKRPKLENIDRIILVWISRVFSKWKSILVVAKASTLIGWHRKGFKLYWKRKSRRVGRPNIDWPLIKLIRRIQKENPTWSAQRIQGELGKLGFSVLALISLWHERSSLNQYMYLSPYHTIDVRYCTLQLLHILTLNGQFNSFVKLFLLTKQQNT